MAQQKFSTYHNNQNTHRARLKDKKISLAANTSTVDNEGIPHDTTAYFAQGIWAYVRQIDQTKRASSVVPYSEEEYVFYINWRDDLDVDGTLWLVWNSKVYEVTRVDTYEQYKRDMALYAKTGRCSAPRLQDID